MQIVLEKSIGLIISILLVLSIIRGNYHITVMCVKLTVWYVHKDCPEMEIIQPLGRMNVLSKIHGNISIDLRGKFWFDSGARRTKEDVCSSHFFLVTLLRMS